MSTSKLSRKFNVEKLHVKIFDDRQKMGRAAAQDTAEQMRKIITEKGSVNMIFAAAPSQNEFLEHLISMPKIDWSKVIGFHMDEYVGLPNNAPQQFSKFLQERLFEKVSFKDVHYINGNAENLQTECERYRELLRAYPVDITCMGIGENGHIAFNDPSVADFNDPHFIRVVELDDVCRQQQVNSGCFETFDEVPTHALTLTIPALMAAKWISCVVPGKRKAFAVDAALKEQISTGCPASILRTHDNATLYLDKDSARLL